jgi:hypothetical protein
MREWLAIAAILPFAVATGAHAQMNALQTHDIASVAKTRILDLRLSEEFGGAPSPAPLMRGLIVSHEFAPNAGVGVGLANIYDRKRGGDSRVGDRPRRSGKPAVTFVVKF